MPPPTHSPSSPEDEEEDPLHPTSPPPRLSQPIPPTITTADAASDSDSADDELPDYRFLPALCSSHSTQTEARPSIPKRGEKDSAINSTQHQAIQLRSSRAAMHMTLSYTRTHAPQPLLGYWRPGDDDNNDNNNNKQRCCWIPHPRGTHFKTLGRVDRKGEMWLAREEMLFLLERGGLCVLYAGGGGGGGGGMTARVEGNEGEKGGGEEEGEKGKEGCQGDAWVSMSLQGAYAVVFDGGLTMEEWVVYEGLKRAGFVVLRVGEEEEDLREGGGGWEVQRKQEEEEGQRYGLGRLFRWLFGRMFSSSREMTEMRRGGGLKTLEKRMIMGPLVKPGLYRSYNEIYNLLSLIPYHDPRTRSPKLTYTSPTDPNTTSNPYRLTYKIYKPSRLPTFKKSSPGKPDYLISVINAREFTMPTLTELSSLLSTVPYDPPPSGKQLYQRLKHGWRNVILAIVDQGVVSYLRVSEAGFGVEAELKERLSLGRKGAGRGGKGGGGRGRGRGRGRGGGGR
ncbi:MAG: tRNA-splicing endonuclease subunit sen54 [Peltula sp. TS41687]|nr:MAG: tRNA-splicing endonuclease subunit sen54 [Peltula sp. TS41687]